MNENQACVAPFPQLPSRMNSRNFSPHEKPVCRAASFEIRAAYPSGAHFSICFVCNRNCYIIPTKQSGQDDRAFEPAPQLSRFVSRVERPWRRVALGHVRHSF